MQLKDKRKLSTDPDFNDQPDPLILTAVMDALVEAAKGLEGIASGYTEGADNAVIFLEDGSEGPHRRQTCRDHHPQCPNWAKWVRSRPVMSELTALRTSASSVVKGSRFWRHIAHQLTW